MSPHEIPGFNGRNRSGVAQIHTFEDEAGRPPTLAEAIQEFRDAREDMARMQRIVPIVEKALRDLSAGMQRRANSHHVLRLDTNSAPLTDDQGRKIDVPTVFGGEPGLSLRVVGVGGGNLEININGQGWLPVSAGDLYENETILTLAVRVTSGGAGTAILRLGAYLGG